MNKLFDGKDIAKGEARDEMVDEASILAKQREEARLYRNKVNAEYAQKWKEIKPTLDAMTEKELKKYIRMNHRDMARIAPVSFKLSPREYAQLRLAMIKGDFNSIRDLLMSTSAAK